MRRQLKWLWALPLLALAAFAFPALGQSSSDPVLVGNQTVQSLHDGGKNVSEAFGYTATTTGTATSINVYLDSTDGVHVALYGDSSSKPAALLDQARVSSNAAGWVRVPLSGNVTITSGKPYWIAIASTSSTATIGYRDLDNAGTKLDYSGNGSTLGNPFSIQAQWKSNPASAYVSGTAATTSTTSTTTSPTTTSTTTTSTSSSGGGGGITTSPNPGNGISTDPNFFPIGVWDQTATSNAQNYAKIGVNTYVGQFNGNSSAALSAFKAPGLGLISEQDNVGLTDPNKEVIKAWESQPDEPDNAQPNGSGGFGPCVAPSTIVSEYSTLKAADPTRPVYVNFGRGVADVNWSGRGSCTGDTQSYVDYSKGANIVSFDIYPINEGYPLSILATGVDKLRGWAGNKPLYGFVETTPINSGNTAPTPAQVRAETWLEVIHGANGVQYFCHIFTPTFIEAGCLSLPAIQAQMQADDAQIKSLAPVLNSPVVTSGGVSEFAAFRVDTMTKVYRGNTYVFSEAVDPTGGSATFTVPGGGDGTVSVVGENRSVPMTRGSFTDTFGGYGVHIYEVAPGSSTTSTSSSTTTSPTTTTTSSTSSSSTTSSTSSSSGSSRSGSCSGTPNTPGGLDPFGGCFPGSNNTGVSAGTTLTPVAGGMTVNSCGAVLQNLHIQGDFVVQANNGTHSQSTPCVTLNNSEVDGFVQVGSTDGAAGGPLVMHNDTVNTPSADDDRSPVLSTNYWAFGLNVEGARLGFSCQGGPCVIQDSYAHAGYLEKAFHYNALGSNGATGITLNHDTVSCDFTDGNGPAGTTGGCSDDVGLFGDFQAITNVRINQNLFVSPSTNEVPYCINAGFGASKPFESQTAKVSVTNNVFQRGSSGKCGTYGPVYSWPSNPAASGSLWSGNTWDDGTPLNEG